MKKYEVVMAARRMRLANKLAHEHLKGEWVCEPEVTWGPSEVSKDPDYCQQELPL